MAFCTFLGLFFVLVLIHRFRGIFFMRRSCGKSVNLLSNRKSLECLEIVSIHLFNGCIESPAIAVTVSVSSCSLLMACIAENPTVCASCFTQGQWVIWIAIVFWSVSIADGHGGRESSSSLIAAVSSPSKARTHSWTESQIAGRS